MRLFTPSVALLCALLFGAVSAPAGASVPIRHHARALQAPAQTAAGGMASEVAAILASQPAALRAHWGISMVDAGTGTTLFSENADQLFAPASNAKLFTISSALALLGPTYTLATRVLAEGAVDAAGTLHGDLRLVGGADMTLSGRQYPWDGHTERPNPPLAGIDALAAQVAASSIHAVDGPVLADDTLFPYEPYGAGWEWDDLQWEYGAPISALPVNDDARFLAVTPGAQPGAPVTAAWNPDVPGISGDLLVTATTSAPGTKPALGVSRLLGGEPLRIYGSLPAGGAPVHMAIALEDPARFAGEAFRAALLADGVAVSGPASAVHRQPVDTTSSAVETHLPVALRGLPAGSSSLPSATARVVASRQSVPLSEVVTVIAKVSQNLHAELLLHLLGNAETGDASAVEGARVRRALLTTEAGIAPDDFLLYDGSGLSPNDRVTPRAVTTLLRWSTTQPWGRVLRTALPIGGVDGTLEDRLANLRGRVQAKTGTLSEASALSGFLTTDSGRTVIFSILCNDYPGSGAHAIIDALVTAAAHDF